MNQAVPLPASTLEQLGLHAEILSAQTLGRGVQLAWLSVRPASRLVVGAMVAQKLAIEETDVVAKLRVRNDGERPVLLPADWILEGGKQSRVVARSVVIAARHVVDVPVRCVEERRWAWGPEGRQDKFAIRGPASTASRATFAASKKLQQKTRGTYDIEQGDVWGHVAEELSRTGTTSKTRSYVDFMRGDHAAELARADALVAGIPARANGVLAIDPTGRAWFEALPRGEELRTVSRTIVAGALGVEAPERRPAERYLYETIDAIWRASIDPIAAPPGTLGAHAALGGDLVSGALLLYADELVHVAASVA